MQSIKTRDSRSFTINPTDDDDILVVDEQLIQKQNTQRVEAEEEIVVDQRVNEILKS